MQQLTIEHKKIPKTTSNHQKQQVVIENKKATKKEKDRRREGKGRILALSRRTYRLLNSDTFYVESESSDDLYYFVKFKPDVFFEWCCCCPDNSTRHVKCKHIFAIEFAIKWGTLKDIDKLPASSAEETKRYNGVTTQTKSSSYEEDEYSF